MVWRFSAVGGNWQSARVTAFTGSDRHPTYFSVDLAGLPDEVTYTPWEDTKREAFAMFGSKGTNLFENARGGVIFHHPAGTDVFLRGLTRRDRKDYVAHLKRLTPEDRQTRFFHAMSDTAIEDYSRDIDWIHTRIFGAFVDGRLRAVAELTDVPGSDTGEIAVTTEAEFQHAAFGRVLIVALLVSARVQGLEAVRLNYLTGNHSMHALVSDLGATITSDHGESEAVVPVPRRELH